MPNLEVNIPRAVAKMRKTRMASEIKCQQFNNLNKLNQVMDNEMSRNVQMSS
jgi:hypothetical protein